MPDFETIKYAAAFGLGNLIIFFLQTGVSSSLQVFLQGKNFNLSACYQRKHLPVAKRIAAHFFIIAFFSSVSLC
jgi:ABC-type polysaccharide/polyol phosphate export permease